MKNPSVWLLVFCLSSTACCLADNADIPADPPLPQPVFRSHFLGRGIGADATNGTTAQAIAALPSTHKLLDLALDQLAITPARLWQTHLPKDASNRADLLRPLLSDLLTAESWIECHEISNRWDCTAAFRLNPDQSQRWNTNLWQILSRWKLGSPQPHSRDGVPGWEIADSTRPFHFRCATAKNWVVLGLGSGPSARLTAWLDRIRASDQPVPGTNDAWLDLEINWPQLLAQAPFLGITTLPRMRWTLAGAGEYVRNQGDLTFAMPLNLELDPWLIPTNLIYDPLVSFTAARGIRHFLKQNNIISAILTALPNQFFLWGQPAFHGQTLLAAPCAADPAQEVHGIMDRLPAIIGGLIKTNVPGEFYFATNASQIFWSRLPLVTPFLTRAVAQDQSFLLAGLFPYLGKTNPPPQALLAQLIDKDDLVYYDWEVTEERILHHLHYFQLATILAKRKNISSNDVSYQWVENISKQLGNTVTEITLSGPNQLSVVRRSHLGFTGAELVLLARWIDSPGFPLTFELPARILLHPARNTSKRPARKDDPP